MSSIERAFCRWAETTPHNLQPDDLDQLRRRLTRSYVVYGDLLLLSASVVDGSAWRQVSEQHRDDVLNRLLQSICSHLRVTRIAVNRPIPAAVSSRDDKKNDHIEDAAHSNVLRSPVHFQPLHGDFGPERASEPPTEANFKHAYWVTARQNGIAQTWAPRWTMFSRGNINEKTRVLNLPSVAQAVDEGARDGTQCSAVDLYAGIGYFAFCYVKADVAKVLCWEINEWSCEGLRRGADCNQWGHKTYLDRSGVDTLAGGNERLIIFNESNEHAPHRVRFMRETLPPVRHVNCGLLPTSRDSWPLALAVLDTARGGWIHVHENFAIDEIEGRAEQVRSSFQAMVDEDGWSGVMVKLEFINRVKSYAPGVFHCVLDVYVPPRTVE